MYLNNMVLEAPWHEACDEFYPGFGDDDRNDP